MIKVPTLQMRVVFSEDIPAYVGKIQWKPATWLTEGDRERANEWLADRFGRAPYILLFDTTLVMHPAHRQYVGKLQEQAWPQTTQTY